MAKRREHPDERKVEALRRVLNAEEPLPLGMRSRMEAGVAAERRRKPMPGFAFPTVLGLACFIGGSALQGLQAPSVTLGVVLTLGSVAYGVALRRLVAGAGEVESPGRRADE
jgi:hypothetical protein